MDWDREERERAIQEADRLKAEFERDEWQRTQRQKRSGGSELVYKTYKPKPMPQQSAATMDEATQAGWDKWAQAHIANALAEQPAFSEEQGDVIAYLISELRAEWRKEISEELAKLRAEMTRNSSDSVLECWPRKKQNVA